jgi:hypothetical protein
MDILQELVHGTLSASSVALAWLGKLLTDRKISCKENLEEKYITLYLK